jgi:hypothetical protein
MEENIHHYTRNYRRAANASYFLLTLYINLSCVLARKYIIRFLSLSSLYLLTVTYLTSQSCSTLPVKLVQLMSSAITYLL